MIRNKDCSTIFFVYSFNNKYNDTCRLAPLRYCTYLVDSAHVNLGRIRGSLNQWYQPAFIWFCYLKRHLNKRLGCVEWYPCGKIRLLVALYQYSNCLWPSTQALQSYDRILMSCESKTGFSATIFETLGNSALNTHLFQFWRSIEIIPGRSVVEICLSRLSLGLTSWSVAQEGSSFMPVY